MSCNYLSFGDENEIFYATRLKWPSELKCAHCKTARARYRFQSCDEDEAEVFCGKSSCLSCALEQIEMHPK